MDAAILFNIADNLIPKDSEALIRHVRRIIKPAGWARVKINLYQRGADKGVGAYALLKRIFFTTCLYLRIRTTPQ